MPEEPREQRRTYADENANWTVTCPLLEKDELNELDAAVAVPEPSCFHDEGAALALIERVVWGGKMPCRHCGKADRMFLQASSPGCRYCGRCLARQSLRVGTIFERSKVPIRKWLLAIYLLTFDPEPLSMARMGRLLELSQSGTITVVPRIRSIITSKRLSGKMKQLGWNEHDVRREFERRVRLVALAEQ